MNRFVISPDFVEAIGSNSVPVINFTDVLFVFTQDNSYRILIDNNLELYKKYKEIGIQYDTIRFWLKIITENPANVFYKYPFRIKRGADLNELCIYLAAKTPRKILITAVKDLYSIRYEKKLREEEICIIDGAEAKELLSCNHTIIINQSSNGHNSGNTVTINKDII